MIQESYVNSNYKNEISNLVEIYANIIEHIIKITQNLSKL